MHTIVHEPEWTKRFPDALICNYYFYLSVAVLIIAVLSIVAHGYMIYALPSKFNGTIVMSLLLSILQLGVVYYIYLFAYLLCSRTLLDKPTA